MSEWQPIETAPKDGTAVWIWFNNSLCIGCYIPPSAFTSGGWRVQAKVRRNDVSERRAYGDCISLEFGKAEPTKWQPLPPPPGDK